ncbi:MAG TPA: hypothetical protein VGY57_08070 [Vicinamibacterales bacterium]|nr:hypothetical protein [Vicinamibacterales bacterium]
MPSGVGLFLIGFLVLFLELACIRWFAANVIFLQFFTNVVLLASFLGLSCGCLAARQRHNWLARTPALMFVTFLAAILMLWAFHDWSGVGIDVHQQRPQEVFFGTEGMNSDVAQFVVPIEFVAGVFFVLIALLFVGLGQALGRAFDAYPERVRGYSLNIAGSLAGIVAFAIVSFAQTPPLVWFLIACGGIAYVMRDRGDLTFGRAALLGLVVVAAVTPTVLSDPGFQWWWSPYYAIRYRPSDRTIAVNTIGHQVIVPFDSGGAFYSAVHLLQRHSGGKPFRDVLVIGAGNGNDVAHALRFGAERVDAVEIDPAIQKIGVDEHPDRPYEDPRTVRWLDDGQHHLRTTDRTYDLVVYALVDSLILHSTYANIRLESFLFTDPAFADVRRVLKPVGVFIMYNYFRQGWIVRRAGSMAEKAFGTRPIAIRLPYADHLESNEPVEFVTLIAGNNLSIADAFRRHGTFWLNAEPPRNLAANGFDVRPETMSAHEARTWMRIPPAVFTPDAGTPIRTSDDWPFLYVRDRVIPAADAAFDGGVRSPWACDGVRVPAEAARPD